MNHADAAFELTEERASLPELLLGLWLDHLENEQRGTWVVSDDHRAFVLNEDATVVFLLGRTPEGGLFLGVGPEVAGWFLDLEWRYVLSANNSLRLCLRYEEDDFFLVIPVQPVIFSQLPTQKGRIDLSELAVDEDEEDSGVIEYERVRTRTLPYHYRGGRQQ